MSNSEIERFSSDLKTNPALAEDVADAAGDLAAIVALANDRGYVVNLRDVRTHLDAHGHVLSDEALDRVAAAGSPYAPTGGTATPVPVANVVSAVDRLPVANVVSAVDKLPTSKP